LPAQWKFCDPIQAIAARYPNKTAAAILRDLVDSTPGEEGKWFAAAKSAGFYERGWTPIKMH
jgi:hypothetical protein